MTIERRITRVCKKCHMNITYFELVSTNNFGGPFASPHGDGKPDKTCACGSTEFRYCDVDNLVVLHPLDDLDFPEDVLLAFKQESMYYIGDLVSLTESELLALPSVTESHVAEILHILASIDLSLGTELDWPPPGFK